MKRIFKFALVGASGILVNEGTLWLLTDMLSLFYLASSAVAIELSIVSNFLLNDFWTFADRKTQNKLSRGIKYNIVSLVSVPVNMSVLFVLVEVFNVYYLASNMAGILCAFLWNYFVNSKWTWKKEA